MAISLGETYIDLNVTLEVDTPSVAEGPFRLGDWLVEPRLNRLTRDGESIQIELKMMDVLVCLASHTGELVERQTLIDTVWATEFISENILTRAIAELRNVLGDDAKNPSFIETIHRRGYRLIAPVEAVAPDEPTTARVARFPVPEGQIEEKRSPYPGLSAFTEDDAEYFFGRESEVSQLWRKITTRRLLAVIGPSGVGKTSLVRAGIVPAAPGGWRTIAFQPGDAPYSALARALAPEFRDDPDAIAKLVDIRDDDTAAAVLSRWRGLADHALLIIDQFEELFTQNPPEIQGHFAALLRRVADHSDVNVLIVIRDDFLIACYASEALSPIFSELTPITTPSRSALRRALVNPAVGAGFAFEDDSLVDEMLDAVEGEQAALPMLAFTVARLWQERDRDRRFLTREAYERIGGVQGSLAMHAEAVLSSIGGGRLSIVRELFRNLVTAQGTRAMREADDLLSVFDDRQAASEVLAALTDARLLNVSELQDDEGGSHRRVEIVHESLLASWPRLVRWQTQDADAAQLREELRQAARTWDEHGRTDDMMWTGSAYREFAVWRERYPGGLTEVEGAFAAAMTSFATRRRRRRRMAAAAVLTIAVVVAAGFATLWRRSVLETRRAEAAKLLALARVQLDTDPTEALSYTTASLEVADSEEARVFALRLLWEGPHALELAPEGSGASPRIPVFSPDGSRLAAPGHSAEVRVWTAKGGDPPLVLPGHTPSPQGPNRARWASDELLLTGHWTDGRVRAWAIPGGRLVRTIDFGGPTSYWWAHGETLFAAVRENDAETGHVISHLFSWRLPDGERKALGSIDRTALGSTFSRFDRDGSGLFYGKGNEIFYRPLPGGEGVPDRLVGSHDNKAASGLTRTEPGRLWTRDAGTGEMRQWDLTQGEPILTAVIPALESAPEGRLPDPSGRWVRDRDLSGRQARVWDREAWSEARPLTLRRSGSWYGAMSGFHPAGDWLVVSTHNFVDLTFWPLRGAWPRVVDGYSGLFRPLAFSADGRWLATSWSGRFLRLWPLPDRGSGEVKVSEFSEEVRAAAGSWRNLAFDPGGRYVFVVGDGNKNWLVPLDGSLPRKLESFSDDTFLGGAAVSPSGRQVATAFLFGGGPKTLRVWDVETGELRLFDLPDGSSSKTGYERGIVSLGFADESTLYTGGDGGVRRWNLENGEHELVLGVEPGHRAGLALGADGGKALVWEIDDMSREKRPAKILDLTTAEARELPAFGQVPHENLALDSTGKVAVTGDEEGIIRVGYVTCGEPHLLVGHEGPIDRVAISPDLRWVASTGEDNTLRLWPMPDLDKPPLHTLPHDELIAKLHTLTNLRAVRDPDFPSGWKLEVGPFPGWAEVPEW